MHRVLAVLMGVVMAGTALAQTREVCLDDQADLNAPTLGSFYKEFQVLVGAHGVRLEREACRPGAIRISLHRGGAGHPSDVLGAAPIVGSRIAPHLEIYLDRVVGLMPETNCWTVVGRALARVAAHEVGHFIDQDQQHTDAGLLQTHFTGAQLAAEDSYPFRWISSGSQPPADR